MRVFHDRFVVIEADIFCPYCGGRHTDGDDGEERWTRRAHTTHQCHHCNQHFRVFVRGAAEEVEEVDYERRLADIIATGSG